MKFLTRSSVALIYGLLVIGSGVWRYLERPDGEKGLWFGVVMGAIALVASFCFRINRTAAGWATIWLSILFVGGWFIYEALIKKGFSVAEPRMLAIIGLTVVTAIYFLIQCVGSNSKIASSADLKDQ